MNTSVDNYFVEGCGRCTLGGTPDCKVHRWTAELELLRKIILDCGLTEESKWGAPCYTFQNKNMLMLSALKGYCCISFFKGSLLSDHENLLVKPGPNSQAARLFRFQHVNEIQKTERHIKAYIFEAIELEKAGLTVTLKKNPEPIPVELEMKLEEDPVLKTAFEALTPGRQRGYVLHFSKPKRSETRIGRIEKCIPMILQGTGLHDRYKSRR
ncbi:MAG: hypothetical protein HEP71_01495 [Roseivirga sp.]|nr:hypothetical protein [Roseivirga sp.]